jgi:hypothetical protein
MKRRFDAVEYCQDQDHYLPLLTAVEVATGARPHLSTILRWCTKGARGRVLESVVLGGRRMTTVRAVQAFMVHCPGTSDLKLSIPADRTKAVAAAAAKLRERTRSHSIERSNNSSARP